ncbi:MAG: hypothetical protein H6993_03115 [Pseudomonadales bacterium]|nr:hypothetical protein [Pseudomonadales bacterium]MCP5182922.1 hypothetical protein [Pseudomonadales bacterium]
MKLAMMRSILGLLLSLAMLAVPGTWAESMDWGPAPGTVVQVDAPDQSGQSRTVADLSGTRGLLLFLNRSADW